MRVLSISLLLILTGCATQPVDKPRSPEEVTGERLLASPPQDWSPVYEMNNGKTRISDFVPPGDTGDRFGTKLSFQSHLSEDLDIDPVTMLMAEAQEDMNRCNFVQHFNIHSGYENNYETSVRLFLCGENAFTNRGEVKLIKAIRGDDYFYSIRIIRRIPVFDVNQPEFADKEIAVWSKFLSNISVCNDTPDHPCP